MLELQHLRRIISLIHNISIISILMLTTLSSILRREVRAGVIETRITRD